MTVLLALSCTEEEYEQSTVTFYPNLEAVVDEPTQGMGSPYRIELRTSRILARESKVNIRVHGNGAGYGSSYVTYPPMLEPGTITLTVPAGENQTYFDFVPMNDGIVEVNDYNYKFQIEQTSESIRSVGQSVFKFTVKEPPLFSENFNECSGSPATFTERIVDGAMAAATWGCTNFGYPSESTKATEANAFNKGAGVSNSYLVINNPIDGTMFNELIVKCLVYSRFSGAGQLKLKYSTNYSGTGNPEADGVTWTEVDGTAAQMPSAGSQTWTEVSGSFPTGGASQVYIAFQYIGGTTSSASNWRVEDVTIKGL